MPKRTTLLLDDEAQAQLDDLSEQAGSQSTAVRQAIADAHAALRRRAQRQEFIDWLIAEGGEPTGEDREWARRVAIEVAAAKASLAP